MDIDHLSRPFPRSTCTNGMQSIKAQPGSKRTKCDWLNSTYIFNIWKMHPVPSTKTNRLSFSWPRDPCCQDASASPSVWASAASPASPSLALRRSPYKAPVHTDWLAHKVLAVQPLHGRLGFFVRLIFYQRIALKIARPSIQVQMQVLDFPIFCKFVVDVLFCCFFVYTRHKKDPTLYRSLWTRLISILFYCVIVLPHPGPCAFIRTKTTSFPFLSLLFQLVDTFWQVRKKTEHYWHYLVTYIDIRVSKRLKLHSWCMKLTLLAVQKTASNTKSNTSAHFVWLWFQALPHTMS